MVNLDLLATIVLSIITIQMSFLLSHIKTVLTAIRDAKAQVYQIQVTYVPLSFMAGRGEPILSFITQDGLTTWNVILRIIEMPICHFKRNVINFKSVLVYINDVLIFSPDFSNHLQDLSQVSGKLHKQASLVNLQRVTLLSKIF